MAYDDITPLFRDAVKSKRTSAPLRTRHGNQRLASPADIEAQKNGLPTLKLYMEEASAVLNHINNMTRVLAAIRRPYLNLDSHARPSSGRTLDLSAPDAWSGIKHLTNEERDKIDLQARVVLSKCADRVKEMERIEKRRLEVVSRKGIGVLRLLPARLLPNDALAAQSDFIASHSASVTWYLNRRLAEASAAQKEMQEERVKRQMERTRTLGSAAARDAALFGVDVPGTAQRLREHVPSPPASSSSWMPGGGAASTLASSFASLTGSSLASSGETLRPPAPSPHASADLYNDEDDIMGSDDTEIELTQSQILQFESENASILRTMQDTLASVQRAESSLLEISALQMELVAHLTQQTEITDKLFEDAVATSETVDAGNRQLIEARKRQGGSRLFVLVFLLGASFALLFLHFY